MKSRKIGTHGPSVSALGLGCMGLSEFYGTISEEQGKALLEGALERGINFFDTADMYGVGGANEKLLGRVLEGRREQIVLATKFAIQRSESGEFLGICGKPEYVKEACEASLKRLGTDYIDLYYQHRVDPNVPIEETVGAMAELVKEGKVRHLGLSEASVKTLQRAQAVHPIAALQTEYSLWSRDPEAELLAQCESQGTTFVAYSPLGRGFLSGQIRKLSDLDENDWRRQNPRFSEENFTKNLELVDAVAELAKSKGATSAQIALSWLLHKAPHIIPIPGTSKLSRLEENIAAIEVELASEEISALEQILPLGKALGTRYPDMSLVNG